MAGDWIPMRHDLPDDPAVIAIATATGLDEFGVIGRLHRLWSWADRQTTNGNAPGVTALWLNACMGRDGFAEAMLAVGWLALTKEGIAIPKFDEWISESAKVRALAARRARKFRAAKRNAASVTKSARETTTVQDSIDTSVSIGTSKKVATRPTLEEVAAYCQERGKGVDPQKWFDHYSANGWKVGKNPMREWKAAVRTWEHGGDFFDRKPAEKPIVYGN
jgi:hypothetical protein